MKSIVIAAVLAVGAPALAQDTGTMTQPPAGTSGTQSAPGAEMPPPTQPMSDPAAPPTTTMDPSSPTPGMDPTTPTDPTTTPPNTTTQPMGTDPMGADPMTTSPDATGTAPGTMGTTPDATGTTGTQPDMSQPGMSGQSGMAGSSMGSTYTPTPVDSANLPRCSRTVTDRCIQRGGR